MMMLLLMMMMIMMMMMSYLEGKELPVLVPAHDHLAHQVRVAHRRRPPLHTVQALLQRQLARTPGPPQNKNDKPGGPYKNDKDLGGNMRERTSRV
jgi:hypothetical protein